MACGTPFSSGDNPKELIGLLSKSYRLKKASHLSWAVRLVDGTEIKNDGGESGAGNCILDTMRETNTVNCLVLVARWYGGKHLGGLRFRIYRKTTAELISEFSSSV
jgi:putative IMPACT (imprinted ancient) family translation regulator